MATKKEQKKSDNVADLINGGIIKNLADVNWEEATRCWNNDKAKEIIDKVNDRNLRPFIIDAMISEWKYKEGMGCVSVLGIGFESFLNAYKEHTLNYELFNIDIIRGKQNQEIAQIQKDIKELKEKVFAVPDELNTDEAKALFDKAIKAGFMNNNYKFVGTRYQAAYFAELAAEKLNLKYKWKYFQILWGYDKLAQTRRESKERFGKVDKQDEIEKIFN